MADDIPFDKNLDLAPDTVDEPMPGLRRVMADNPGPFTFKGTLSYILGRGKVAIVDPGPADERHIGALLDAVRNETVTAIFVTHTHRDHSPAVPAIKAATGATVYAEGPHRAARPLHIGEMNPLDSSGDRDFRPDVALKDGEVVAGDGWTVEAVTTPGHTANHMAYALREKTLLFAGDHVMGWATSIVAPPDGAMSDYMASLNKLAKRGEQTYFPGHGPAIRDASRFVNYYILHRKAREAVDPAPAGERRNRYPVDRARDLYRHRSAADRRGRPLGAGAYGRPGDARAGGDRRRAGDRRRLIAWPAPAWAAEAFFSGSARGSGAELTASSISSSRLRMRAALAPKSCKP